MCVSNFVFITQGHSSSPGITNGLKRPAEDIQGPPQRKMAATELMISSGVNNGLNGLRGLTSSSGAGTSLADVKKSLNRGGSFDNKSVPGTLCFLVTTSTFAFLTLTLLTNYSFLHPSSVKILFVLLGLTQETWSQPKDQVTPENDPLPDLAKSSSVLEGSFDVVFTVDAGICVVTMLQY